MMMQSKSVIGDKDRYVSGSGKFQTLCHMTRIESYSKEKKLQVIKVSFLHLQMYTN